MRKIIIGYLFAPLFLSAGCGGFFSGGKPDYVDVAGGRIEGVRTPDGISAFKGIPYAASPTGELRWKAPQSVEPWDGVRKAVKFAPAPVQDKFVPMLFGVPLKHSEDCLYLNVWAPARSIDSIETPRPLPVMVWIHGGAFEWGSASMPLYDGSHLAEKGVVVVSVGYRLGVFGFFAHPELTAEGGKGNFGLQDQIAALEWVRENIAAFGGDPRCVTIFGESAGAVSVNILAASPQAKGLFHRVIAQSGALFTPPRQTPEGSFDSPPLSIIEKQGEEFLRRLNVRSIEEARKLSAKKVHKAGGVWTANYDGDLLPADLYGLYKDGRFNDTPVLTGINSDECRKLVEFMGGKGITPEEFERKAREALGEYADKLLALYPHKTKQQALRASQDIFNDAAFAWKCLAWQRMQATYGKSDVFGYCFDHRTPPDNPLGPTHGEEIAYVFGTLTGKRPENAKMSALMSGYWVNFAKTGNPNGEGLPEWKPFTMDSEQVLRLTAEPEMIPVQNADRLKLWDEYFAWKRKQIADDNPCIPLPQ
ncbi:MAG: carboxylesterase/lipase family protein [Phycisphaerae bacterium]|jgi:para-nitrobenzyl esterase